MNWSQDPPPPTKKPRVSEDTLLVSHYLVEDLHRSIQLLDVVNAFIGGCLGWLAHIPLLLHIPNLCPHQEFPQTIC